MSYKFSDMYKFAILCPPYVQDHAHVFIYVSSQ